MNECLTNDLVNDYLAGRMEERSREEAEDHLGRCGECRRRLADSYEAARPHEIHTRAPDWLVARVLDTDEHVPAPSVTATPLSRPQVVAGLAAVLVMAIGIATFYATRGVGDSAPGGPPSDPFRQAERASMAPRLTAPANGAVIASDRIEFVWTGSESANRYAVVLLDEQSDIVFETSTTAVNLTLTPTEARLERGRTYYWYASAIFPGGTAVDSEIGRFSLADP